MEVMQDAERGQFKMYCRRLIFTQERQWCLSLVEVVSKEALCSYSKRFKQ